MMQLLLILATSWYVVDSAKLPHGMVLMRLPISQGINLLAEVWLREGEEYEQQIGAVCHQMAEQLDECRLELLPKIRLKYKEEQARRLTVLSELTRDEVMWSHSFAAALESNSTVALRLMLKSVIQELGQPGAGKALYHALDAAHGWYGNGGQHHAFWPIEGYVSPAQLVALQQLAGQGPLQICQVGFNAGHSASQFLLSNPSAKLLSFDLAENAYFDKAEKLLGCLFPSRHEIVKGNSELTIPAYHAAHPEFVCHVSFIDGDHSFDGADQDIRNMARMASPNGIVVLDDMDIEGVRMAWIAAITNGIVHAGPQHPNFLFGHYNTHGIHVSTDSSQY